MLYQKGSNPDGLRAGKWLWRKHGFYIHCTVLLCDTYILGLKLIQGKNTLTWDLIWDQVKVLISAKMSKCSHLLSFFTSIWPFRICICFTSPKSSKSSKINQMIRSGALKCDWQWPATTNHHNDAIPPQCLNHSSSSSPQLPPQPLSFLPNTTSCTTSMVFKTQSHPWLRPLAQLLAAKA